MYQVCRVIFKVNSTLCLAQFTEDDSVHMNPISSELCLDPLLSPTSKGQPLESKALEKKYFPKQLQKEESRA